MKLYLSILENLIDLPSKDSAELRRILDDLGLEVKGTTNFESDLEFNIETLANRGDHLSALGVARELSARTLQPVSFPELAADIRSLPASVPLKIETELCSRIAMLQADLGSDFKLSSDLSKFFKYRPNTEIPIVDLSAYIGFELGHPTHAFDFDKIKGEFRVEVLKAAEKIVALDSKEYEVPAGSIVGRDDEKICVVSGVIGCANSMVTAETKRVLIEAAVFDPITIRRTARAMGLSTDASYAFERGVDREIPLVALRRMLALSNMKAEALSYFEGAETDKPLVSLSLETIRQQFNLENFEKAEILNRLTNLGYVLQKEDANKFCFSIPAWRLHDVEKEEDLIEDLARSISFSKIQMQLPDLDPQPPAMSLLESYTAEIEGVMQGLGFSEVISKNLYSLVEVEMLQALDPTSVNKHITIKNALEKSCSHLKITNLIHLAQLFERNLKRGLTSFKVYENARVFAENLEDRNYPYKSESDVLSLALGGRIKNNEFRKAESIEESFYWFKGVLQSLLVRANLTCKYTAGVNKFLHPGRQAQIVLTSNAGKEITLGFFGQLHPQLQKAIGLNQPMLYAELDLYVVELALANAKAKKTTVSDLPSIQRDLTLTVAAQTLASQVLDISSGLELNNLKSAVIVDDFRKANEDFRRVSYRFLFQNDQRTLNAEEVETEMQKVIQALAEKSFVIAS
jgi:phenylalanyl-tRNA synthetase beta chain